MDLRLPFSTVVFDLAWFFFVQGCVNGVYVFMEDGKVVRIKISLKYLGVYPLVKSIKLISKPGSRVYMSFNKFVKRFVGYNLQGFFIIFSSTGIYTSDQIMLMGYFERCNVGEIIFRVSL